MKKLDQNIHHILSSDFTLSKRFDEEIYMELHKACWEAHAILLELALNTDNASLAVVIYSVYIWSEEETARDKVIHSSYDRAKKYKIRRNGSDSADLKVSGLEHGWNVHWE